MGAFAAVPALAAELYCRLDDLSWLGCPAATPAEGDACHCPTAEQGHVHSQIGEDVFDVTSESTKLAPGITRIDGPVSVFVPRTLLAHRDQATTATSSSCSKSTIFFISTI